MKQFILIVALFSICFAAQAQKVDSDLKLSTLSFQKTFQQEPLVIDVKKARKSPTFELPKVPNIIWKHHPETVSYYNNHRLNPLCFNQSNGWEMIQVRPMKHQVLYDAAAIGGGIILGTVLEALSQL
ncbi:MULTISPECIES: hypothetical protein [unclassified Aureispira]|uniref:hypothetical protein n=1 Tax=unclassified Aureispira TaxID=2649989 RepID=UPI000698C479|nr:MULTISPECIES: hypothetical protein [unclassified Aureispira]WMX16950.1 hypothetical protein QP953_11265 [Aureispira sp. CCB-E]